MQQLFLGITNQPLMVSAWGAFKSSHQILPHYYTNLKKGTFKTKKLFVSSERNCYIYKYKLVIFFLQNKAGPYAKEISLTFLEAESQDYHISFV